MESVLAEYVKMAGQGMGEADWTKVRGLEFREALGERDTLVAGMGFLGVDVTSEEFQDSVCPPLSPPRQALTR
jgi:hypothetical protein